MNKEELMRCYICDSDENVKPDTKTNKPICDVCLDIVQETLVEYGIEDTNDFFWKGKNNKNDKQSNSE